MRLAIIIIIITAAQVSAKGYSQNINLNTKNTSIQDVFSLIKEQSGYSFFWEQSSLSDLPRINITIKNANIKDALNSCLKGLPLTYNIQGKIIYIKQKQVTTAPPHAISTKVIQREIHGRVTDTAGNPVAGATVIVKNTKKGAFTNAQGEYKIEATAGDVLQFSFVGYNTKEMPVGQNNELNITLTAKSSSLNEIVIVGYGTQKKADVTGAVSTIKMDDVLGNRPVSTLPTLLQNVSPGLQVSISSGQPGASSSFNVRGGTDFGSAANSSINTGGPFILVDNVPFNGGLNLIDPNDIESITVLKDAGSAAIYGARSAFGVILITTKKGKLNQKAQLNYSDNFTLSTPMNLPQKVSPQQQVQALIDGGRTTYYTGQVLTDWDSLLTAYHQNPSLFPGGYSLQGATYYQLAPTDAIGQLIGNAAFQQTHNLSVSGGSEKTTYRLSGGYTNENGILLPSVHQDNYKRYNLSSDVSTNINKWWNVQLNLGYNNSTLTRPYQEGNAFSAATYYPSFDALDTIPGLDGFILSPANEIKYTSPVTTNQGEIRATARTVISPVEGLKITAEYAIDNTRQLITSYDQIPQETLLGATTYVSSAVGTGTFSKTTAYTNYNNLNVYGNYNRKFGYHNITLMMGYNQEQSNYEQEILSRTDPINSTLPSISTSTGATTGTDNYVQFANRGAFGRINYDYKGKYLLQLNGRYDGSSKFPPGHQWGFFPSASVGWQLMQENFMKSLKNWVNEFKLRASYGSVGNQNIGNYGYFAVMDPTIPWWLNNSVPVTSLSTPGLISSDYTWETVNTLDIGADWGALKNKLTGSFDWYSRTTKDILTTNPAPMPSTLGTGAPLQNAGALRTNGFELQVNWKDKIGKVNYYVGLNLYNYTSIVTKSANAANSINQLYVGQKLGDIWGYTTDRLYTTDDFVDGTLDANLKNGTLKPGIPKFANQNPNPGDVMYKDFNGDTVINGGSGTLSDPGDRRIIGNSTPKYQFGFNGGVSYKNFSLSFFVEGVLKRDMWISNPLIFPNSYYTYSALYTNELNYWTPSRPQAFYGRIYTDDAAGGAQSFNQSVQTRFLQNGAFIRIKNITLNYSLPASVCSKIHANSVQLFYSMENVVTFDHLPKGLYPDVATIGGNAGNGAGYPFMRKSSIGINVSF